MQHRLVNPWTWQESYGFAQAHEVTAAGRLLFVAGQTSVDPEGRPVHPADMSAQVKQALANLKTVVEAAGGSLRDVVRLNYYTTDVKALFAAWRDVTTALSAAGCKPASTVLGVGQLALPELLVEIEATAALG